MKKIHRKHVPLKIATFSLFLTLSLSSGFPVPVRPVFAATYTWGSSGETVAKIQDKLKRWGYYTGNVDGKFGSLTYEAVKYFQRSNSLVVDGIAGPRTLEAMGIFENVTAASKPSSSVAKNETPIEAVPADVSSRENDIWLLACVINGEGRGEGYIGQVAIGAVVMNRVGHAAFPSTLSGVIYQAGAFDAVKDGQIKLEPSQSCLNAARDAMNGWDPTEGAIYYWNPVTATSKWIKTLTITKEIGNHVFSKG